MKKEEERGIKRWLKRKISINEAVLVLFLITGGVSFAASPRVRWEYYYSESNTNSNERAERLIIVPYAAINGGNGALITSRYNGSNMQLLDFNGGWNTIGVHSTGIGSLRGLGANATAMGYYASALGAMSTAVGNYSSSGGESSSAFGDHATSSGRMSSAFGYSATASNQFSTAFGASTVATGGSSTAVGYAAKAIGGSSTAIGEKAEANSGFATAMGHMSNARGISSSSYGYISKALGDQSTAIGSRAEARAHQSTAIGNDTFALGTSSIAFGSDDTSGAYNDSITQYDYDNYFKYLYGAANGGAGIDTGGIFYGFGENGGGTVANRKYSPTVSRGTGAIAVGSRSVAFANGSVSIGTLAFSLKEGATALGTKTRAEGIGSMALGNLSNVFSDYSVATGNKTQVTGEGGMAYGYQAYSAGVGALALGREVSANARLKDIDAIRAAFEVDAINMDILKSAGDKAKNIDTGTIHGVTGIVQQNGDKNYAIVVGNKSAAMGGNSLALGGNSFSLAENSAAIGSFSYADAKDAMAIGVGARVFDRTEIGHTGIASMAIGKDAVATLENSIALGVGSKTDYSYADLEKEGYAPKGAIAVPTSGKTGVISVGKKGEERRIVNVASGYLNTDAANVGQLKILEDTLNLSISENAGKGVRYLATNKTGGDSLVLEGKLNTASDYKSYIDYVALRKTIEARIKLNHENISQDTIDKIDKEIARLKAAHPDFETLQGITALDAETTGNNQDDAEKYAAILKSIDTKKTEALEKTPSGAVIDNYHNADNSGAKGADSIAIGYDAETSDTASNAVAIGKAAKVTAVGGVAIGDGASVDRENSVAIGKGSMTTGSNDIGYKFAENAGVIGGHSAYNSFKTRPNVFTPTLGEFSIGNGESGTRRLTGLAAGLKDTDAVNVGQYKALAEFKWRFITDSSAFNRALTSVDTIEFLGNTDISTSAAVDTTAKKNQLKFTLNKETSIAEVNKGSEKVATTAAVYNAIKDSKAAVSIGTDDLLTLTGEKTADIAGNTFTLGINKTKLTDTIGQDFAKKDASNILDKTPWVTKLSEGTDGLVTKGQYTTGEGINPSTWKTKLGIDDIPTSWNIKSGTVTTAIDKANNTLTVTGADGVKTALSGSILTISADKSGQVIANDTGIVTGGKVRTAIDEAKTTLAISPATGGILSLQTVDGKNKAYTLSMNEAKLKETLGVTNLATEYAKADASNIVPNKVKWVEALSGTTGFAKTTELKVGEGIDTTVWRNKLGVDQIPTSWSLKSGDTTSIVDKTNNTVTVTGTDGIKTSLSGHTLSISADKTGTVTAGNQGIVTGGNIYTAIEGAKTTLAVTPATGGALELTKASTGTNNSYTLQLNNTKLKENLGITNLATDYAKADASNISSQKQSWITALSGTDGFTKYGDFTDAVGIDAAKWKNALGVSNIDLRYKANGDTASKAVALSTGLTLQGAKQEGTETSGKNIWVESAADGVLNIKMAEKPEFTEVKTGSNILNATGLTVGGTSITSDKITATTGSLGGIGFANNQTTGLAAATTAGNAVEYSQFTQAIAGALDKNAKFTVRDEAGAGYEVKLSDPTASISFIGVERDFVNPDKTISKVKNIKTSLSGSNLIIDLNDKVVLKSASIAGVTFTNENNKKEIHAGDAKITNLADGEVAEGSRGAVNGGQLWTVQNLATAAQTTATEAKTNAAAAQKTADEASRKANANETNIASNTSKIADHATTLQTHTTALANHESLIDKNTEDIAKGFVFSAENAAGTSSTTKIKQSLGDTIEIFGDGKNLSTSIDQNAKIIVSLKESPKFGNLTINDSGKITGLLKGTLDTDAVNLGQLKPIATAVNAVIATDGTVSAPKYTIGTTQFNTVQDAFNAINTAATGKITFSDGGTGSAEVALGDSVKFQNKDGENNIKVELNSANRIYNFSIVDNPIFAGKVTGNGFDAKNQKIENVLAGNQDNDAVNYKQLQDVKAGLTSAVNLSLESPVTYMATVGAVDGVGGTKTIVKKIGTSFYKLGDLDGNGQPKPGAQPIGAEDEKILKVSTLAKDASVDNAIRFTNVAPGDISGSSTDAINGSQLKPVLDALAMTWDASNNKINNPQWNIGNKTFTNIPSVISSLSTGKIGSLVLTDANGATIIRAKNGNFYKVSDVNLDTFEANSGAAIIPLADIRYSSLNPTVTKEGDTTKTPMQIGNVKAGTKDTDAVNVRQLKDLVFGENSTEIKPLVAYDGNTKDSITLAGVAGTKITNLQDGTLSADSKDAVTGKQLHTVASNLSSLKTLTEQSWNLWAGQENPTKVNYGDTIKLTSDNNLVFSSTELGTERTIKIATVESPTFGKIKLQNSGDNAVITGLTNKTWDKTSIVSGRAATEDQLQAAVTNINTSTANDDKFNVKYDKTGTDPNYTSITLNPSGAGAKITNLAAGTIGETSKDAINGSQIYAVNKAIGDFIGAGTFNIGTGMINPITLPSVTNNGTEADTNSLTEALKNLRYGFRIFSGKVGEGTIDTSAGATNIGNKQNLAILGDKNISTKVSKEEVQVTRIVDGVSKTDSMIIPKLNITMSENPVFESIAAKKVLTIGDTLNTDPEKNAVISVNPEGKGYITGLRNTNFNVALSTLKKENLGDLSVTEDKAASEAQLKEIIKDYVTRDDLNVKYDTAEKNAVTLHSSNTDGVKLTNVATGTDDKDAVNFKQLKDNAQAVADTIGTTIGTDGKLVKPSFTKIGDAEPTSVVNALTLLGEKISSGNTTLEGKIGDPSKDATDARNTNLTGDKLNGSDINSKANALRRGEAGIVVYTKADGTRVGKANDGKYYELSKINADGSLQAGAEAIEDLSTIRQSLVSATDGTTTKPTVLSNLANGNVASGSSDAITGDQLHKVVGSLGSLKTDGSVELNKIKFRGSVQTGDYDKTLGETVSIVGNTSIKTTTDLEKYESKNIATENTAEGISIKFAKNPEFTSIKVAEKVSVGDDGLTLTKDTITGLKDLDDSTDGNTAVNKNFVDAAIAKVTDTINTGNTTLEGKIGDPSKDATDGRNGLLTSDELNGKDINTKANALRRGEAGIIVYTKADGTRVGRAKNGKYYELSRIKDDGTVDDENNFVPSADVRQSLVNPQDGTTNTPVVLSNLANGSVESGSKDAITGDQLHKVTSKLGSLDTAGNLTLNPIKFRGNVQTANYDKTLGEEVKIVGNSSVTTATDLANYEDKNIVTENTADGISIKFAKNPEFTSVKATEKVTVGDGLTLTTKGITGLQDIAADADASSAVNKKFVDDEIAKVTDKITGTGGLNDTVGTGADGRDGKTGTSSTTGPTGKDGQNGKSLTAKVNALRNGEAGPVVYTDKDGNRLYKGNDGQYYTSDKINLDTGETKGFASSPVRLSLVNQEGDTKDNTIVLDNISAGKIDTNSREAVNGSQLKDFADKVGLEVDDTTPTKLKTPDLTKLKDEFVKDENGNIYKKVGGQYYRLNPSTGDFSDTPIASITGEKALEPKLVDRINLLTALNNELQAATQAGITFRGDNQDGTAATQASVPLGKALDIKGGKNGYSTLSGDSYIGGNIGVKSSPTGLEIFTKAKPTFDGITLNQEGLHKTSAVRLDQLNALRRELKLPPITEKDPDGNGVFGDQRNPQGTYPDPDSSTPAPGGTGNTTNDTVNALAKGEAGPVIYTSNTGEKLVLAGDNKFYKPEALKDKFYYNGHWYDPRKIKELDGKLYEISSGDKIEEGTSTTDAPTPNEAPVKLSAVGPGNNTKTPTQLGNIAEGTDGKDATNVDQLNAIRSELGLAEINPLDKDGDGRDDSTGKILNDTRVTAPTGPTGAGGAVGSTGAPKEDGLAGTKLADKIEYLRDGYAGTVVYTDDQGKRIIKGKDGNFYKPEDLKGKVYSDGKWYDAKEAFEKYDLKDGKWVDKGKDTLTTDGPKALNIKPLDDMKRSLSLVNDDGKTSVVDGVVLKNVGKGKVSADSTDAINGSQLHEVYSAINSANAGKLVDGKDELAGVNPSGTVVENSAGSKGNTSKDKLNGKYTYEKANALRNGEAGTLVYTNSEGERLFKGNDGGYYKFDDLQADGKAKAGKEPSKEVIATVVQYDGSTEKAGKMRVGDGEVSEDSTEAVNGSQLHATNQKIAAMNSQNDARFEAHEKAIAENTQRIEKLDTKVNKGLANAAALSGITFMDVGVNQASVAAAVGGYKGTQAVAVGVQAAPTENVRVNAKVSVTPGSQSEGMYSVGAAYRFNFR